MKLGSWMSLLALAFASLALSTSAQADEGMWTFDDFPSVALSLRM